LFPKRDCVGLRVRTCGGECIRYLTHGRIFSLRGKGHQKPAGWGLLPIDDVVVVGLDWLGALGVVEHNMKDGEEIRGAE
jgi:hypothetical protein